MGGNGSISTLQLNTPATPTSGQFLGFDGSRLIWTPAPSGGFALPYDSGPISSSSSLFTLNNSGSGPTAVFNGRTSVSWGASALVQDQGGAIELGNSLSGPPLSPSSTPYIDFHYGVGHAEDYNVRLINDAYGQLSVIGDLQVVGALHAVRASVIGDLQVIGGLHAVSTGYGEL